MVRPILLFTLFLGLTPAASADLRCQDLFSLQADQTKKLEEKILAEANDHLNRPFDERGDLTLIKMIGEMIDSQINPVAQFLTNRNEYPILLADAQATIRASAVLAKINQDTERLDRWTKAQGGLAQKAARLIPGLKDRRIKKWSERVKADHNEGYKVLQKLKEEFEFLQKASQKVGLHLHQIKKMQELTLNLREALQKENWQAANTSAAALEKVDLRENVLRHLDEKLKDLSSLILVLESLQSRIQTSIETGLQLEPQLARMLKLGLPAIAMNGSGKFDLKLTPPPAPTEQKPAQATEEKPGNSQSEGAVQAVSPKPTDAVQEPALSPEDQRVDKFFVGVENRRAAKETDLLSAFYTLKTHFKKSPAAEYTTLVMPVAKIVADQYASPAARRSAFLRIFREGYLVEPLGGLGKHFSDVEINSIASEILNTDSTQSGMSTAFDLAKREDLPALIKLLGPKVKSRQAAQLLAKLGLISSRPQSEKLAVLAELTHKSSSTDFELELIAQILQDRSIPEAKQLEVFIGGRGKQGETNLANRPLNWDVINVYIEHVPINELRYTREYYGLAKDFNYQVELGESPVNDAESGSQTKNKPWSFVRYLLSLNPQSKAGFQAILRLFEKKSQGLRRPMINFLLSHSEFNFEAAKRIIESEMNLFKSERRGNWIDDRIKAMNLSDEDSLAMAIVLGRNQLISQLIPQLGHSADEITEAQPRWVKLAARSKGEGALALLHNDTYLSMLKANPRLSNEEFLATAASIGNASVIEAYAKHFAEYKSHFQLSHWEKAVNAVAEFNRPEALGPLIEISKKFDRRGHDERMFQFVLKLIERSRVALIEDVFFGHQYNWWLEFSKVDPSIPLYLKRRREFEEALKANQAPEIQAVFRKIDELSR